MRKLQMEELGRDDLETYQAKSKVPLVIVLDDIRSGHNVGSILRTCDAFMVQKIWLCGITPTPPHREILKTAIGASASVAWEYAEKVTTVCEKLKDEGHRLIGVEQTDQSIALHEADLDSMPTALIFGNEVNGLSEDLLPLMDLCIEIKQFGTKHSLNVSVCAGITIWAFFKVLSTS